MKKQLICLAFIVCIIFTGCGQEQQADTTISTNAHENTEPTGVGGNSSTPNTEKTYAQPGQEIFASLPKYPMTKEEAKAYVDSIEENDPFLRYFSSQAGYDAMVMFLTGGDLSTTDFSRGEKEITSLSDIDEDDIVKGLLGVRTESVYSLSVDDGSLFMAAYLSPSVFYPAKLIIEEAAAYQVTIDCVRNSGDMRLYLLSEDKDIISISTETVSIDLESGEYTIVITAYDCDFTLSIKVNPEQPIHFEDTKYKR